MYIFEGKDGEGREQKGLRTVEQKDAWSTLREHFRQDKGEERREKEDVEKYQGQKHCRGKWERTDQK